MSALSFLTKWTNSLNSIERDGRAKSRELEKLRANPPSVFDIAAVVKHRRQCEDLEIEISAIEAAKLTAAAKKAEAEAAIKVAEEDAEEREIKKLNLELAKLSVEISADNEKLAAKLHRHEEMRKRSNEWDRRRGTRAPIVDGEYRVRSRPGKVQTRIVDTNRVWVDAHGEVVKAEVWDDRNGRYIRNPEAVKQIDKEFVVREEMQLPPEMPERLADAIKLVNLQGEVIWPPRPVGRTGSYM